MPHTMLNSGIESRFIDLMLLAQLLLSVYAGKFCFGNNSFCTFYDLDEYIFICTTVHNWFTTFSV